MKENVIHVEYRVRPCVARLRKGWTLVELLVVVLITVVLAALSLTVFNRARASANSTVCMSNLKQVGAALLMHAADNNNKLIPLQPSENPKTGKRPPIWTVQLALAGYLSQWDGKGDAPCGTGVWTCPECDFMSVAYGGYGVVEGAIFVYEENTPIGVSEKGSLRLSRIVNPSKTWLVGDATANSSNPKKGWYSIWSQAARWSSHGPAARHGGRLNVCMVDGHVESLSMAEISDRKLTEQVVGNR
jgi:prepilin-type processing-associated H-X9-DG protein